MNKIIPNGSVCLFRKYSGGSRNGKIVLVRYTGLQDADIRSNYTVKEYQSTKRFEDTETWSHDKIALKPLSYDCSYQSIQLQEDELSKLLAVGIFECVL